MPFFFLKEIFMEVLYYSFTGNCKRFAEKLTTNPKHMDDYDGKDEYLLIFPTMGFGRVPPKVVKFLKQHHHNCRYVVSSGNRNWGENFAKGADTITEKLGIPSYKIELAGNAMDAATIQTTITD